MVIFIKIVLLLLAILFGCWGFTNFGYCIGMLEQEDSNPMNFKCGIIFALLTILSVVLFIIL